MLETITTTVECHTCHQPTPQTDAQPFGMLVPAGTFEHGRELWRMTNQTFYECNSCLDAYFAALESEAEASAN